MSGDRARLLESVRLKFTSTNEIPVERAQITRAELEAIMENERAACAQIAREHRYDGGDPRDIGWDIASKIEARLSGGTPQP